MGAVMPIFTSATVGEMQRHNEKIRTECVSTMCWELYAGDRLVLKIRRGYHRARCRTLATVWLPQLEAQYAISIKPGPDADTWLCGAIHDRMPILCRDSVFRYFTPRGCNFTCGLPVDCRELLRQIGAPKNCRSALTRPAF